MASDPESNDKKGDRKRGHSTATGNTQEIQARGWERRDFLKLSATGMVVSLAAGCAGSAVLDLEEAADVAGPPEPGGPTGANAGSPAIPEVSERLPDPETIESATWHEPWTWRPQQWPGRSLQLNVTRGQNPGFSPSPASFGSMLFSFGGISPGPTIRVRNDGVLNLTVRNLLEMNHGEVEVGPYPAPFDIPRPLKAEICKLVNEQTGFPLDPEDPGGCPVFLFPEQVREVVGAELRPNWDIGGHVNKFHAAHTTNIHTHGLHVQPQKNADGSHSDNIFLRVLPQGDVQMRKQARDDNAEVLNAHEHAGELDYSFHLSFERNGQQIPHPPGTHWYHPHSHGSTHIQVSSGMAGFLLVEGDVDQAINRAMTGEDWPDPEVPAGDWDYRERLMMLQRVFIPSFDTDAPPAKRNLLFPPFPAINGAKEPSVIKLRPGAVERWRVLNGSVDGAGTKRFMVLEGQFVTVGRTTYRVLTETEGEGEEAERKRRLEPVTELDIEAAKVDLQQLAMDGITLVRERNGKAEHFIKDLSAQHAGTVDPRLAGPRPGESPPQAELRCIEDCFRDGESLRHAFVRPNEVLMTNANRCDLFFKAPLDAAGKVYTIFAAESRLHSDTHQSNLQLILGSEQPPMRRPAFDVAIAYIHVDGKAVEGGDFDIQSLNAKLPPVPPLLQPIAERELQVPVDEARRTGVSPGSRRTRTLAYTGTGGTDFPVTYCPPAYTQKHADMKYRLWMNFDGVDIMLPQISGTMGIHPDFDLRFNPDPDPPRKFVAFDPQCPRMLLDTAEEWVVYNTSQTMWAHTDLERYPQPGAEPPFRYINYPVQRAEGQRRFHEDPEFKITAKGNDHPFHIHINPMWVLRIDVPDENGVLHNILPEPRWMDSVAIPRNGGRIVFRSRFEDFTGQWINHCHILSHEDNGMMQMIECVDDPKKANYRPRERASSHAMSGPEVDAIYPRPSLELMYRQNLSFVDPSHLGGYEFPGFEIEVPKLEN